MLNKIFKQCFLLALIMLTTNSCSLSRAEEENITKQKISETIKENPEIVVESLNLYEKQQQELQEKTGYDTFQKLRSTIIENDTPWKGSEEKKLLLVEFSDFQCPFCAELHPTLKQFMNKHGDEVTLVYKHFPLNQIHPEAMPAAKAAWAAKQQNKFWEYHNALFENQDNLGEELYLEIASQLGLELEQFNRDRRSNAAKNAIEKDLILGEKMQVTGTPFLIFEGKIIQETPSLEQLENILEKSTLSS